MALVVHVAGIDPRGGWMCLVGWNSQLGLVTSCGLQGVRKVSDWFVPWLGVWSIGGWVLQMKFM